MYEICSSNEFVSYNIFPYLTQEYKASRKKPKNYTEFKDFIKREAMRQWWSRCEYEVILCGWPNTDTNKTADKPNNTIFLKSNLTSNINIMNSKYAIHSDIDAPTLAPIDGKAVVIRVIMANITVNHFGIFL